MDRWRRMVPAIVHHLGGKQTVKKHTKLAVLGLVVPAFLVVAMAGGCGQRGPEISEYEEITIASPAPTADHGFQHPPMGGSMAPSPSMPPPGGTPAGDPPGWTTPAGWEEEKGQGMRLATFLAAGDAGDVECSLIVLGGAAGGLPANVNRWIGQLGMDTLSTEDMAEFISRQTEFQTEGDGDGVLIDLTTLSDGDDAAANSMVVGVVDHEGKTIFAKMMGSVPALRSERDRLLSLCASFN